MSYELDLDVAVHRLSADRFAATVTDRWTTVAQPNGGYVLGIALNALRACVPFPDPVTSTTHFLRPAKPGPAEVVVDVARIGRSIATASGSLFQDGEEVVRVLASFADLGAATPTFRTATPPELPAFDAMDATWNVRPDAPNVAARYAHRMMPGALAWLRGTPSGEARKLGYLAFRDGRPFDTFSLPIVADSLPPSLPNVVPTAFTPTVELTVHVRARPAPGPLRASFVTRELAHGFFEEDGELWDEAGSLVAMSRQLLRYYPPRSAPPL